MATTTSSTKKDIEATKLWHMRLGHAGEKSLQILAKKRLLKGTKACKIEFCEHCVMGKQRKVKFGIAIHNTKLFWIMCTQMCGDLPRLRPSEVGIILLLLSMNFSGEIGCIL